MGKFMISFAADSPVDSANTVKICIAGGRGGCCQPIDVAVSDTNVIKIEEAEHGETLLVRSDFDPGDERPVNNCLIDERMVPWSC